MPLVVLSGFPCSGKTRRALQLKTLFEARISSNLPSSTEHTHYNICVINDESLGIDRKAYAGKIIL